jgi:hypothetical protein
VVHATRYALALNWEKRNWGVGELGSWRISQGMWGRINMVRCEVNELLE